MGFQAKCWKDEQNEYHLRVLPYDVETGRVGSPDCPACEGSVKGVHHTTDCRAYHVVFSADEFLAARAAMNGVDVDAESQA